MRTKICTACKKEKSISEFHKHKYGKYGVRSVCNSCRSEKARETWPTDYKKRESNIRWKKEHRHEHRDVEREYSRKYSREHPEIYAAHAAKRRAKKKAQTPPDADSVKILEFYKEARRLTKTTGIEYQVDHIIPLAKGGPHHQDNLRVITAEENLKKSDKLL